MGVLAMMVKAGVIGATATTGTFVPVSPTTDPVFQSLFYKRFDPNQNPTVHDLCLRKIPLSEVKPLLQKEDSK